MSEKYTPSIDEIKRCWSLKVDVHKRPEREAEFDRAIAKIKSDAVREAAELRHGVDLTPTIMGEPSPHWWYGYLQGLDGSWRDHLRAHAEKIEEDAG